MKRNLSGKDLNKAGRKEDKPDMSVTPPNCKRADFLVARLRCSLVSCCCCLLSPESQGVVSGVVFVIVIIFLQLQYATDNRVSSTLQTCRRCVRFGCGADESSCALRCLCLCQLALVEYNAALHSIGFMIFLGFVDDVVDLPWRYKLILPTIASLPLVVAYSGSTYIAVPWPLVEVLGSSINLGILYQVRA